MCRVSEVSGKASGRTLGSDGSQERIPGTLLLFLPLSISRFPSLPTLFTQRSSKFSRSRSGSCYATRPSANFNCHQGVTFIFLVSETWGHRAGGQYWTFPSLSKFIHFTPFSMESFNLVLAFIRKDSGWFLLARKTHTSCTSTSSVKEVSILCLLPIPRCFCPITAPQVLTYVLAPLAGWSLLLGIRVLWYLDD